MPNQKLPHPPTIAIVGPTGLVGNEALQILAERNHPSAHIHCYGSPRSVGKHIDYQRTQLPIKPLDQITTDAIACSIDYALLCADGPTAIKARDLLAHTQTAIIDNSSAFRMAPDVPLVIPEINAHLLSPRPRIVANPNCSTIMLLAALAPIREALTINSIQLTTYQAVSGAGKAALAELRDQTQAYLDGQVTPPSVFPTPCAFNVFEHESPIDPATGFNGEETKIIQESRRICNDPNLQIFPTCVRVPVERAHAQSIVIELDAPTTADQLRSLLNRPGIKLSDPGSPLTPRDAANQDDIHIGRIRIDPSSNHRRAALWISADQIRKGAALNAIQIMDTLHSGNTSQYQTSQAMV
tara:strand:- start:16328 stop:17392 length:1065 start_codon:yes stop_codon:yes gene_type:complete